MKKYLTKELESYKINMSRLCLAESNKRAVK